MCILVYGGFLSRPAADLTDYFLFEVVKRLSQTEQAPRVLFLVNEATGLRHSLYEHGDTVVQAPGANKLGQWWWIAKTLPAFLQKEQVEMAVGVPGDNNNSKLPLILVVSEFPLGKTSVLTRSFGQAKAIVTTSVWGKAQLVTDFQVPENKITVIPAAADPGFHPVEWDEKEAVKEKYAGGNEYFLFHCPARKPQAAVEVLRAFSVFKKWQKSSMKLLITGFELEQQDVLKLDSYRFRADILLLPSLLPGELSAITASAYASVQADVQEMAGVAAIRSLQCDIPVIAPSAAAFQEICGKAALYSDAGDFNDMGQKMILLYKDELLRSRLIAAAKTQKSSYHWDLSAAAFREMLDHL